MQYSQVIWAMGLPYGAAADAPLEPDYLWDRVRSWREGSLIFSAHDRRVTHHDPLIHPYGWSV